MRANNESDIQQVHGLWLQTKSSRQSLYYTRIQIHKPVVFYLKSAVFMSLKLHVSYSEEQTEYSHVQVFIRFALPSKHKIRLRSLTDPHKYT
jgi:hypothetical protein